MKKVTKAILKKREKRAIKRLEREKWLKLREEVKVRQNNKCYYPNCTFDISGKNSHIHHIVSRQFKELKYDPENLVLLCTRHHIFDKLAVHETSIYFSELLRTLEPSRYQYLLSRIKSICLH